ncbi:MAG TPA: hypothetical protein VGI57_14800, partial [Usitatibacter sp.]
AETPAVVMHKVLQADPEPPSKLVSSLPVGFDTVLARALAKKADDRFQNAIEFQAAMLQALRFKGVGPAPGTAGPRRPEARAATAVRNAPALSLPPEVVAEVERSLTRHVGPLAKLLVKRTQGEAASIEDFFKVLAESIPDADEQQAFMKKMATVKPKATEAVDTIPEAPKAAPATRSTFNPETLAKAEKQLASYVGPLARVLIKQAAESSGNLKELYTQLASHIDSDEERRAFLATLPR